MKLSAKCQYCSKPIELEIDDCYAELRDPYKLVPRLACNRCADFRAKRADIFDRIKRNCEWLHQGLVPDGDLRKAVQDTLRNLCNSYLRLLAKHRGEEVPKWDEEILHTLMGKPDEWKSVMGQMLRLFTNKPLL